MVEEASTAAQERRSLGDAKVVNGPSFAYNVSEAQAQAHRG